MPAKSVIVSTRVIIVVNSTLRAMASEVALVAEPTNGPGTFSVPLKTAGDTTNTPTHYWTSWAMDKNQYGRLMAEFGRRLARSMVPIAGPNRTLTVPEKRADYWIFDAGNTNPWTPDGVLNALGLAPIEENF